MQPLERRWNALRTLSTVLRVLAWIVAAIGVITVIVTFCGGLAALNTPRYGSSSYNPGPAILISSAGGIFFGILELIYFGIAFVYLLGAAELIMLFIALEENTRLTALRLSVPPQPYYPGAPGASYPAAPSMPLPPQPQQGMASYPPPPQAPAGETQTYPGTGYQGYSGYTGGPTQQQ